MQTYKISRSIVDTASDQMVGGISGPKDGSWGQWSKRTKYVHPKKQREQQRETPCAVRLRLLPFPPDKSQMETHNAHRIDLLAKDAFQTPQRSSLLPPCSSIVVSFSRSYESFLRCPTLLLSGDPRTHNCPPLPTSPSFAFSLSLLSHLCVGGAARAPAPGSVPAWKLLVPLPPPPPLLAQATPRLHIVGSTLQPQPAWTLPENIASRSIDHEATTGDGVVRGGALPAQMRATVEEMFQMRVKMAAATAFLWLHDSHPSLILSTQKLPACNAVSLFSLASCVGS